jgi:tRNA (cytosine49-C5)-methyltransferase
MKKTPKPKPLFLERMKTILKGDYEKYLESLKTTPPKSIRCNTLKISVKDLKKRLEEKGWDLKQPFKSNPEIITIQNTLEPGELGKTLEHLLGYYYIQEIASMLPVIALDPKPNQMILDLCASPGSKTTQIASQMENTGAIIANDLQLGRIKILASNLERSGVANTIITKKDGFSLCQKLKLLAPKDVNEKNDLVPYLFDKILVDAPCSGEGTLRTAPRTAKMWNIHSVRSLSKIQKSLLRSAFDVLKVGGELVYSTCTHAPEENEAVVDFFLKNFDVKIQKINIPIKSGKIITKWQDEEYLEDVKYSCRVYPHEYNTEGFFLAKFKKLK